MPRPRTAGCTATPTETVSRFSCSGRNTAARPTRLEPPSMISASATQCRTSQYGELLRSEERRVGKERRWRGWGKRAGKKEEERGRGEARRRDGRDNRT